MQKYQESTKITKFSRSNNAEFGNAIKNILPITYFYTLKKNNRLLIVEKSWIVLSNDQPPRVQQTANERKTNLLFVVTVLSPCDISLSCIWDWHSVIVARSRQGSGGGT